MSKKKAIPDVDNVMPTHIENLEGIDLKQAQKLADQMPNMDSAEDQMAAEMAAEMARNLGKKDQPRTIEGDDFRVNKKVEVESNEENEEVDVNNEEETKMQKNITIDEIKKIFAQLPKDEQEKICAAMAAAKHQKSEEESEGGISSYLKIGGGIAAVAALGYLGYSIFSGNGNEETVSECAALLFA